jgi:ATP-dependent Zn protease
VHARDKKVSKKVDYTRVARASAGFTGAQLMNLMNVAAIVTVRRGGAEILETDIFQVYIPLSQFNPVRKNSSNFISEDLNQATLIVMFEQV